MAATAKPDLIIVGQVTVDDIVPADPGPWARQIGGSSLYAVAGARLWMDATRIGVLARVGRDYPFDVEHFLRGAGLCHIALPEFPGEHLVEWLIYEPDGSRRSLPRNPEFLDVCAEGASSQPHSGSSSSAAAYRARLLDIAPTAQQIPAAWLPAAAVHLCPQAGSRHFESLAQLRGAVRWISVDPSPHYSRALQPDGLAKFLSGATAVLPSAGDVRPLLETHSAEALVMEMHRGGIPEVLLKRGGQSIVLAESDIVSFVPSSPARIVDPTGAGDSFCGAYAACRLIGHTPLEAARRAAATAALVVGCLGVEAALRLTTPKL